MAVPLRAVDLQLWQGQTFLHEPALVGHHAERLGVQDHGGEDALGKGSETEVLVVKVGYFGQGVKNENDESPGVLPQL